ncbi:hypothetical protein E2C01_023622 [Portunus trituberculatus]|uniref:Uncharacterized protein n=1 Tax=Portunus trituberculatus TaxID=210409 RepID=A0A5B7E8E9_PORTR|nr:hypothetical protein [Portunus trituberculatus]
MIVRSRHLRDLLEKALMVAGNLYDKSDEAVQEVKKIEEAIEAVRSQQLIKSDIIIGIADNRKEEFVRRYHEEMWKHGRSKQDTEDLINYIKNSESHLKSHYRLPLNLVLLTWLWADDPREVVEEEEKVSVPHKLLHDFYAAQCIVQNLFNENQESKIKSLMQKLSVFLNMEDVDPIMKQALLSKAALTPTAPKPGSLKAVIDDLCIRESGKMNKYQSMLLHVAGIIYALHGPEVREWIAKEIVELLKESELGVRDDNQWFDLCELTKNEPIVISHISRHISKSITITDKRIGAALLMLQEARPKEISVSICRKTRDIPELQDLMTRIADVESQLDLSFWEDFWEPDSLPSNDQQVRTVSKRCNLGKVVCHVSGSVLAEMQGTNVYLNLAVTSDVAAQEVMVQLCNLRPNLKAYI